MAAGRTATPQRSEKREGHQGRTSENKENVAEEKGVEAFALPPPRTPVSSKKNARPNKNVLNTANRNTNNNGTKACQATPKGRWGFIVGRPPTITGVQAVQQTVRKCICVQ